MTSKHAQKSQAQVTTNGNGRKTKDTGHFVHEAPTLASSALHPLGEKIFLDRYALKDGKKETVKVGDTVIVAVNLETGQREIGAITALQGKQVTIQLRDGEIVQRALEQIDKPLETHPSHMLDRVARGLAEIEAPEKQAEWQEKFRWLLDDWRFVPGGRILTLDGYPHRGQPVMLTEFGGIAFAKCPQAGVKQIWGYTSAKDEAEFTAMYHQIVHTIIHTALFAGFCYTQFADTFQEANGLLCADRTPKIPLEEIAKVTRSSRTYIPGGV